MVGRGSGEDQLLDVHRQSATSVRQTANELLKPDIRTPTASSFFGATVRIAFVASMPAGFF
jgi:hypothetical protein